MNWLGKLIQKEIAETDTVLDLGCGIFQATTDSLTRTVGKPNLKWRLIHSAEQKNLKCHSLLGCELVEKYIDVAKFYFPVMRFDVTHMIGYKLFADNSFDIVMAIDVLEHIEFETVEKIISEMKRISRKKVIIYTPFKFESNEKNVDNAWNLGSNMFQEHKSLVSAEYLKHIGFDRITFPKPDMNTFAIWEIKQ